MATLTVDRSINVDDVFSMTGSARIFLALPTASRNGQYNVTGYTNPWVAGGASYMPVSSNWQSLCYGNNLVVAVSSTSGTIAASTHDGTTWVPRVMPSTASWYAIEYGLDLFVAVSGGGSTAAGSSPDGAVWTARTISASGDWRCIAFGQATFVILSYNSTAAAYSTNGTSWSNSGALPATRNWISVAWGENTFVAVASGPTDKGAYSTDAGQTWQEMTMPSSQNWTSVTYGNGIFVAVATGTTAAAYSADGITWNAATMPASTTWIAVKFGNNRFVAVTVSTTNSAVSDDGIVWRANVLVSQALTCLAFCPWPPNSGDTLAIVNNSTVTVNSTQSKFWAAVTLTNGKLLITNSSTSTGIRYTMGQTTTDAAAAITPASGVGDVEITGNWIELGTGSGSSGQTLTAPFNDYIPVLWVETASGSGVYEQWLNVTGDYGDSNPILREGLSAVGKEQRGKFFVQQAASAPFGPTIINSTLGSYAQKLITATSTTGLHAGASVKGTGIPAGAVVNRVISSTQFELSVNTTQDLSPDWSAVCFGNSVYVAVSTTYSNVAATSADGITWTRRTLPFEAEWTSVCYGATSALFVAVCSNTTLGSGFCASSADGITWTRRAMPSIQNWTGVASDGTNYAAVGQTAANGATTAGASSTNGTTWVATVMGSQVWNAVAYGGSRFVAVGTGTVSNYDADGAGTWSTGATLTSATYKALAYNGTTWCVISGSSTGSQTKNDPTTGAFAAGGTLPLATGRGIAWDGTNFVVVYTTLSVNTSRSTNGASWTNTTLTGTQIGNWLGVVANGTTLVAVSNPSVTAAFVPAHGYAMTSTDSGANWTVRTGMPTDMTLVCVNPFSDQLTTTVEFGDNLNGNKVPTGAKVRCPNIMFTTATPASVKGATRTNAANMVMTAGGSLTASICLFDDSYNNFQQAEVLSLTNVGFSMPPLITECYGVTMSSVGFALEPVRRYFVATTTVGWTTRDTRYGSSSTNIWNYINGASISDLNVVVGQPQALHANQTGATIAAPASALYVTNTEGSVWTNIRFYGLNINHNFQAALSLTTLFNSNTITNMESYGLAPFFLGVSTGNTITNITYSEDMWNGYKNMASAYRIGNDPIAGTKLANDTKYYLKTRSFRDWTDRTQYYESRVYSATPFIGEKYFPEKFSAINVGYRQVTCTWVQRAPVSTVMAYEIFRSTSPGFTPAVANKVFGTLTAATVAFTNGFVDTITAAAARTIQFTQATRRITLAGGSAGSFVTSGFVAGMNIVVAGTTSNNGTFTILTVDSATQITLTTNHTNLVNEGPLNATATLNGEPPSNATTYYYKMRKYSSGLSGITNSSGTVGNTALTTTGNFNTGLGTIANCGGISGQTKIRIPVGSTTNFLAGFVAPGMQISGGGVGASATVVSIDTPWQITVSVANASTFIETTLSLGAVAGMYVYGPGLAQPTKVVSVDSATAITVDTAFIATFSGSNTLTFLTGFDGPEVEVYVNGATAAAFNYLAYTDDFTNAAWVKTNMTVTANSKLVPRNEPFSSNAAPTAVADNLVSIGPSATAVQTITYLKSGNVYNFSVYVCCDVTQTQQSVAGEIAINTTSPTTQSFTATNKWQRVAVSFTATSTTHTFTVQINTPGGILSVGMAQVNAGSTALAPVANAALPKFMVASGGRTLTFATAADGVRTITGSSGSFVTDGFAAGDTIVVSGSASNDGTYVISATTVTATVITLISANVLVNEAALSSGSIVGATLPAAAQELTLVAAWGRSTGGNTLNQGIELTIAATPVVASGTHYTEIYLGTTSGFTPTDYNRVGYVLMPGSNAPISLSNSNDNFIQTFAQRGYGGLTGALITLTGSSDNKFLGFTTDFNFGVNTASVLNVQNLSNNNIFDDFTIKGWRNTIASFTPFTFLNNASGVTIQNMTFDTYDFPIYTSATNSALGVIMKGVSGGAHAPLTTATVDTIGTTTDGIGAAFTTVYDTMFHEMYTSPTTGSLQLRFNASSSDTPPYTILSGSPAFDNTGKLYFRTAGDSIEITWPYRIYGVSSFRDVILKKSGAQLGSNLDVLESLLIEYKIDVGTGSTYGAYQTATPANLAAESVSTTTGFLLKIKITARPGMLYGATFTNKFIVGEEIEGATSLAYATVDEAYNLTATTGCIVLSGVTGSFLPTEVIRRKSDDQLRATNAVTNTQFALFPSFNSYIDGLEIYTNTVGPGDYPGQIVNIVLSNVVSGSTYYVYKTSGGTLLGSGTASGSTVTITNVAYVADFGITIRVRKASSEPQYLPFETQATVKSSGVDVYVGQIEDAIIA